MKKKITAICLVVALAATAIVGGTLAYFTDRDEKANVLTVGNVEITLTEPNWDTTGSVDAEDAYPGEPLAKDPTVENVGANPCFVRVKVEWDETIGEMEYRTDYAAGKLGDGWVDGGDGYFYYTKVLDVNDGDPTAVYKTDALFDQIVVPTDIENGTTDTEYTVTVSAEAVQAQGAKPSFAAVEQMTLEEIQAWFATCMAE